MKKTFNHNDPLFWPAPSFRTSASEKTCRKSRVVSKRMLLRKPFRTYWLPTKTSKAMPWTVICSKIIICEMLSRCERHTNSSVPDGADVYSNERLRPSIMKKYNLSQFDFSHTTCISGISSKSRIFPRKHHRNRQVNWWTTGSSVEYFKAPVGDGGVWTFITMLPRNTE